jgi:hypothetical protein
MISFYCFNDGKCEWLNGLHAFASQYNKTNGTDYKLSQCLDITGDTTRKQPEVRLDFSGHPSMVIERKRIVYPLDYYKRHRSLHQFWHVFAESFKSLLEPRLQRDFFEIGISHDSLCTLNGRSLTALAASIVESISSQIATLETVGVISSEEPIPWSFYRVPIPDADLTVESGLSLYCPIDIIRSETDLICAKAEIGRQLGKQLADTCKKLEGYEDCLAILILEICGDIFSLPSFVDVASIINASHIPQSIHQVWLAIPRDESGQSIVYHQVYRTDTDS